MTMLSMQILRKRTNQFAFTKILVLVLGFLCCALLQGCQFSSHVEQGKSIEIVSKLSEQQKQKLVAVNGRKVTLVEPEPLYLLTQQGKEEMGQLSEGMQVKLKEMDTNLLTDDIVPLQDVYYNGQEVGISGLDVKDEGKWKQEVNHRLPLEKITTQPSYTLVDQTGQSKIQLNQAHEYIVYVKQDFKVGVEFQGQLFYLDETSIASREVLPVLSKATSIPVLMYHFFYDETKGEVRKDNNEVEVQELTKQLNWLKDNGYTALTMSEVESFMKEESQFPEKSFAITIDDGNPTVYKYAYPILKEMGYNATLFLITGWLDPIIPYEMIEMREDGLELQSHSFLMHQGGCKIGRGGRLLCVDKTEGIEDTKQSLDYVDGGFVYCYPFGDVNDHAIEILKEAGVRLAFTTEYGKIKPGMNLYKLPRIRVSGGAGLDQFIKTIES